MKPSMCEHCKAKLDLNIKIFNGIVCKEQINPDHCSNRYPGRKTCFLRFLDFMRLGEKRPEDALTKDAVL